MLIHSSVDGHLGCFYFLTIMNDDASMNIYVEIFVGISVFNSLEYLICLTISGTFNFIHSKYWLFFRKLLRRTYYATINIYT